MPAPKRKPAAPKPNTTAVGAVFAAPAQGGYAACQIVRQRQGALLITALDWYAETSPTLAQLTPAKPLLITHHFWRGNPHALWVGARVPRDWHYLGNLPAASIGTINSHGYGYADAVPYQAPLQWHWDNRIPPAARKRYEATKALAGEQITIASGDAQARVQRSATKISIGPEKELAVPVGKPVDWRALEPLGCLSEVDYTGTDTGVLGLLERAPIIRSLSWQRHGQARIDVRSLDLDELILDHDGPLTLLADRLSTLTVLGSGADVTVKMPAAAALHLRLSGKGAPSLPIKGLDALARKLGLQHFTEIDFAQIAKHADLIDLDIFARPRTRFSGLASLAKLTRLKKLEIRECYGLDAAALKGATLPSTLEHVVIRGYTKENEAALRACFGSVARFELSLGRDAEWLTATLLNPFDWSIIDPNEAPRATKAWATAIAGLQKAKSKTDRGAVLRKFVMAFNTIQKRGSIPIDAVRAAEVEAAFGQLSERAKVPAEDAARLFAEWRRF